jgi:hypothetical protein
MSHPAASSDRSEDPRLETLTRDRAIGAGSRSWYFPDGDTPPPDQYGVAAGHEALLILNVAAREAHVSIDVFWVDREPTLDLAVTVDAERVVCLHPPYGSPREDAAVEIPVRTQYALRVRSDVPIVCQLGRIEVTPSFGMYTTMGWSR